MRFGMPYSRIAASQTAFTCAKSIRATAWQRIRNRLCASVIVNGSQRYPSPVKKYPLKSMHQSWFGAVTIENGSELGVVRRFFRFGLVSPARLRI
jgi:hypothetical protein